MQDYKQIKDKELKQLEKNELNRMENLEDIKYETLKGWTGRIKGKCFRFWVFKKGFTPYENEKKFIDESLYEDNEASFGYICEVIVLPDKDILIGFSLDNMNGEYIEYYKLTDIRLAYVESDNKDEEEFKENEEDEEIFEPLPFC